MHVQSGPMKQRAASRLYTSWVLTKGGEICGEDAGLEGDEASALRLDRAMLYLDSRRAESASGARGDTLWRDLSGNQLDVDVSPSLMAPHGGFFACVPAPSAESSPAMRTAAVAVLARSPTATGLQSTSAAVGDDLEAELHVPHSRQLAGVLQAGCTISCVVQCTNDASDTTHGNVVRRSHFALTVGNVVVGAGPTRDSVSVRVAGSAALPASLILPPGQQSRLHRTRVHQLTIRGSALDYFANGKHVGTVALPCPFALSADGPLLVVGAAVDRSALKWSFEGAVFMLLVHSEVLPRDAVQELAASCLRDESVWGAPRPGDCTVDGAQVYKAMRLP